MDKAKVLERIRKLQALSQSPNAEEAALAAAKVLELQYKYNIRIFEVESERKDEYDRGDIFIPKQNIAETKWLWSILETFYHVRLCYTTKTKRPENVTRHALAFIGTEVNVEIARYVYVYLVHSYRHLWRTYRRRQRAKAEHRDVYYCGITNGLQKQLTQAAERVQSETGKDLMVIFDPKRLDRWFLEEFPDSETAKSGRLAWNERVYRSGFAGGRELRIRRAVSDYEQQRQSALRA